MSKTTLFDCVLNRTQPIHFWSSHEIIETWLPDAILAKARNISIQMLDLGVTTGDCIALILPTEIDLVTNLLATWSCRAYVCIIPYALSESVTKFDVSKISYIFELLQPKLIIHDRAELNPFTQTKAQKIHCKQWSETKFSAHFPGRPQADDLAIIQLTSGSTAHPKGVILKHSHILANMQAIAKRVNAIKDDHTVSWLPLYHDMGLSSLLTPLAVDFPVTLIQTSHFIHNPAIWMEAISQQQGTLSNAPTFAYTLLARHKIFLGKRAIDLSSWRYAWVGAEPVHEKYLKAFQETMQPFGLQDNVLQPAYGLAESVVAVAFNPPDTPYRCLSVDADILHNHGIVQLSDSNTFNVLTLVSNGTPLDGILVSIRDKNGQVIVGHEQQGQVWISGTCVTNGYLNTANDKQFKDGWFNTGDLGFIYHGELYISGCEKDLIIRNGVNVSPAYVELIIEDYLNLHSGKVVIFSNYNLQKSVDEVIVIVGLKVSLEEYFSLERKIIAIVATEAKLQIDRVLFTAAKNILKTTSGKVQRAAIKQQYLDNLLGDSI